MATRVLALISLVVIYTAGSAAANQSKPQPTEFIESSCKETRYPEVCVKSLSRYGQKVQNSEHKLALVAASVTESRTRLCASFVKGKGNVKGMKAETSSVMEDCIENMYDSVGRLKDSVKELKHLRKVNGTELESGIKNTQTWLSSALTHQSTCLDELNDPHVDADVKNAIRSQVEDVSQFTSNALALVNRFASTKHV